MSIPGPSGRPLSKNERRDAARERAREERERQAQRDKRRRAVLQAGIGVVIIAVVAVVVLVIVTAVKPTGPGPKNMADNGIIIGTGLKAQTSAALAAKATPKQRAIQKGVIAIRTYEDFQCPVCLQFEQTDAAYIKSLVDSGKATLQIYPIAILDNSTNHSYSTRAANAAACVANYSPDQFYEFHRLLYAHQPAEQGGGGLDDSVLTSYTVQAKVTNAAKIASCISGETFKNWVGTATATATSPTLADSDAVNRAANQIGTPMVIVDGKWYQGSTADEATFQTFVEDTAAAYKG